MGSCYLLCPLVYVDPLMICSAPEGCPLGPASPLFGNVSFKEGSVKVEEEGRGWGLGFSVPSDCQAIAMASSLQLHSLTQLSGHPFRPRYANVCFLSQASPI